MVLSKHMNINLEIQNVCNSIQIEKKNCNPEWLIDTYDTLKLDNNITVNGVVYSVVLLEILVSLIIVHVN